MKDGRPIVLVTGANGFIGRHVGADLAQHGWQVRRAVRTATGSADEVVVGSIGRSTDWRDALAGVEAVIHLAARVHQPNDEHAAELYRDVNIDGTLQLARAAAERGVRHFIFVSTILVHGRSTDGRAPFRESDVPTPRGLYGTSKAAAEAGLKELSEDGAMRVTVIRPPMVYGAGAPGNFALLSKAVRLGIPLPLAGIRNKRAFLSVDNLASFMRHRLAHAQEKFELFLLADNEQVSTPEFVERLANAAGRRPRLFRLPAPLLRGLLTASRRGSVSDSLLGSLALDLSRMASTGWQPPLTLDEGLRRACAGPAVQSDGQV